MADLDKFKSFLSSDPITKYIAEHSSRQSEAEKRLMESTLKDPAHRMMGAPESLQLNSNLMKAIGAKKVLEIGTYTGLSALSAALALPDDGVVYCFDITDEYLEIGKPHWKEAGVENKIKVTLGRSVDSLKKLIDQGHSGEFDFAFIDADKTCLIEDYENCLKLVRSGGIISIDNTLWSGRVADPQDNSEDTVAIRAFNAHVKDDCRIDISFLPMGDGLTLCFKK